MQASGSGKDFTLDGTKMYVIDGNSAEILIVVVELITELVYSKLMPMLKASQERPWPQWIRHANNLALTLKALPPN